jgi:hypothetical protein
MDLKRLSSGEKIAGASALLLFVLMFFDWFGSKDDGELRFFSIGRSAWEALDYIPLVLVIAIAAALAVATLRLTDSTYKPPVPANAVVAVLGSASALLILFRIVDPPNFGSFEEIWGTVAIEGTAQTPIFLALAAATGIALGGYLAWWQEGASRRSA